MTETFDVNAVAAAFVDRNLERILSASASGAKSFRNELRLRLQTGYREYAERMLKEYWRARPFLFQSEPLPLRTIYEPLGLSMQARSFKQASIRAVASASPHWIV